MGVHQLQVENIRLIQAALRAASTSDESLKYTVASIHLEALDESAFLMAADFSVLIPQENDIVREVKAAYLAVFKVLGQSVDEQNSYDFACDVIRLSLWGKFTDLFHMIVSQAGFDVPRLPVAPDIILDKRELFTQS
jgi:hypothetical protein